MEIMKSHLKTLQSRGYITENEIIRFRAYNDEELFKFTKSTRPLERTVAVNILSERKGVNDKDFVSYLLKMLCMERKLYTKLEICKVLESGDSNTARQMVQYLGLIGNNQYRSLPENPSKKRSYPLPRDIIARTLANMNVDVLPVLIDVLDSGDEIKLSECIDAIGYFVFYHPNIDYKLALDSILNIMVAYEDKDIIFWKCVVCLSAFKTERSIKRLQNIHQNSKSNLLILEAKRSLQLMNV